MDELTFTRLITKEDEYQFNLSITYIKIGESESDIEFITRIVQEFLELLDQINTTIINN